MTSTSFNVGLQDNTRLSSRVLRPPGGGHTDIFGGEPEPPRGRRPAPSVLAAAAQAEEAAKAMNGAEPAQNGTQSPVEPAPAPAPAPAQSPAPAPTPEPKPESPVAPAPAPAPAQDQPRAEPPKRVRVPPGGFSSGLW